MHPHKHDRFSLVLLCVLLAQLLLLPAWELFGHAWLLASIGNNPDALDRAYYGRIAAGMHVAIGIGIVLTLAAYLWRHKLRQILESVPSRYFLWGVLGLSAGLQLSILLYFQSPPFSDSHYYVEHARRLVETGSYLDPAGNVTAFWPVGWPAVLAGIDFLTGNMLFWGGVLNILLNLSIVVLSWLLFKETLDTVSGRIFLIVIALSPAVLYSAVPLMTELPFIFLLYAAIALYVLRERSWWNSLVIGVLLGAASYVRPTGLLFASGFILLLLWRDRRVTHAVLAAAAVLLTILPWSIRNYAVFDAPVPMATNGGFNFLVGNHAGATGGWSDVELPPIEGSTEAERSVNAYKKGLQYIFDHPGTALLRMPKKLLMSYRRGDAAVTWTLKPVHSKLPPWLLALSVYSANLVFYTIVFFGVIALVQRRTSFQPAVLKHVMLIIVIISYAIIVIYVGGERYIAPLLPFHAYLFASFFRKQGPATAFDRTVSS